MTRSRKFRWEKMLPDELLAAILITGHYGGVERERRLLCDYDRGRSGTLLEFYCIADWECIRFEDDTGDHAGICETQQLMALRPELVDLSQAEPSPASGAWGGTQFPDSQGRGPGHEIGERIVASHIEPHGRVAKGLLERHSPVSGWTAPS